MTWTFTDDVEIFAQHAGPLLAARPVQNTITLTVIEQVRAGGRWSADAILFGWYREGQVAGAMSFTPPFELLLAEVPRRAVAGLVTRLRERGTRLPGVNGEQDVASGFAEGWVAGTSLRARLWVRQRLHVLDQLAPPAPAPAGRARIAERGDLGLVTRWFAAFHAEVGSHAGDAAAMVRDRIGDGLLWLWQDPEGRPVSLAGRRHAAAGVARVGPVYTPPEHRRRGYAAAVTAACSQDALDHGAADVVLFTDLANPISNAIYHQLGYRPVTDRCVIRFSADRPN